MIKRKSVAMSGKNLLRVFVAGDALNELEERFHNKLKNILKSERDFRKTAEGQADRATRNKQCCQKTIYQTVGDCQRPRRAMGSAASEISITYECDGGLVVLLSSSLDNRDKIFFVMRILDRTMDRRIPPRRSHGAVLNRESRARPAIAKIIRELQFESLNFQPGQGS